MSSSQHGQNLRLGLRTHRFIGKFAVLHHHKGGDAHDAELRGQFRLLVHIDLANFDVAALRSDLIHNWADHPAGAAPGRPEVQ